MKNKILYISLTGMTEPLGRSQVLEYLIDLSKKNDIFLLSFERKIDLKNLEDIKDIVDKNNIQWNYFIYSNKYGIFSTIQQLFLSVRTGASLIKRNNIQIIHARSFIPAVMGYVLKITYKVKLLFDVRGFSSQEKVDRNRLKENTLIYNLHLKLENFILRKSDYLVTLTHKAKELLSVNQPITVVPTCANKEVFLSMDNVDKNIFKTKLGYALTDKIIIHTGTVSGWYDFEKEVKLIKKLIERDKTFMFLILNRNEKDFIKILLEKHEISKSNYKIMSASFDEVYKFLNIADFSLFFIKNLYSKQASAPTKFAENVSCYLPSITNDIGDMKYYIEDYKVGYLISLESFEKDLDSLINKIFAFYDNDQMFKKDSFDKLFYKHFDKDQAVIRYQKIYDKLAKG